LRNICWHLPAEPEIHESIRPALRWPVGPDFDFLNFRGKRYLLVTKQDSGLSDPCLAAELQSLTRNERVVLVVLDTVNQKVPDTDGFVGNVTSEQLRMQLMGSALYAFPGMWSCDAGFHQFYVRLRDTSKPAS
jgi:hypothetical protein